MARRYTQHELEAYLDESLRPEEMADIERALRASDSLARQLAQISSRRDSGVHGIGEIWRRHRLSCPAREQLGSYLLGALSEENSQYIAFHIETVGCRYCNANLDDLRRQQSEDSEIVVTRRRRYYQSSAGYLGGRPPG